MDIDEIIMNLIKKNAINADFDNIEITGETRLIEDLGYDSASLIRLVVDIEDQLGIEFEDTDLLSDKLNNVFELVELVKTLK